jgi:CheY-like chemotaxis protein
VEDDWQQDIGGTKAGDDKADECSNRPEKHLDVAVFLVGNSERFAEAEDSQKKRDERQESEGCEKDNVEFCHAEIYKSAARSPTAMTAIRRMLSRAVASRPRGVADVAGCAYIIIATEVCAMAEKGAGGVLIVEDEQELRHLFAILLEMEGFTVLQANDGGQGLDLLQKHAGEVRLLITDLNLPRIAGMDLITRARSLNPSIKIVGTSGMSGSAVHDMVIKAGADDFIAKPFQPSEAIAKLKAILR